MTLSLRSGLDSDVELIHGGLTTELESRIQTAVTAATMFVSGFVVISRRNMSQGLVRACDPAP